MNELPGIAGRVARFDHSEPSSTQPGRAHRPGLAWKVARPCVQWNAAATRPFSQHSRRRDLIASWNQAGPARSGRPGMREGLPRGLSIAGGVRTRPGKSKTTGRHRPGGRPSPGSCRHPEARLSGGGPALLFRRAKGTAFPLLGNLFGTLDRAKFVIAAAGPPRPRWPPSCPSA